MTLHDLSPELRTRWVELALEQVTTGHWNVPEATNHLRSAGFPVSVAQVGAAAMCYLEGADGGYAWLVSRLARPVGVAA